MRPKDSETGDKVYKITPIRGKKKEEKRERWLQRVKSGHVKGVGENTGGNIGMMLRSAKK